MTIFKHQIDKQVKGALMEDEQWWWLCYDDETKSFFVEHRWDYVNPYKLGSGNSDSGSSTHDADTWTGPGADKMEEAKKSLLEKAGH